MKQAISIVIPVYNSEHSLGPLLERLSWVLDAMADEYEVILVDDGSMDASWDVVRKLSAKYSRVRGIRLLRNYGQHNAL